MKSMKKILCAISALCVLAFMMGGCGGYCNMCGLGYTDCTVNGCYLFGNHIFPSAEFKSTSEACCQAVKDNKDDLDFAAESLLQYDGKVSVYFANGAVTIKSDDPELSAIVSSDEKLMACLDRLAQNPWFGWISPMQFSLSEPDSIYGISVNFSTNIPAYALCAEYVTDPEMLKYTGANISGDWYFSAFMME